MAEEGGGVAASSFDAYEGIRIVIPGAVVVGLVQALAITFGFPDPLDKLGTAGVAAAAVVMGLVLLFVDLPSTSVAMRQGRPSQIVQDWSFEPIGPTNLFFLLLDTEVPATIRNRALYQGAVYRIGYEMIQLFAVTSICACLTIAHRGGKIAAGDARAALIVAVAFVTAAPCFIPRSWRAAFGKFGPLSRADWTAWALCLVAWGGLRVLAERGDVDYIAVMLPIAAGLVLAVRRYHVGVQFQGNALPVWPSQAAALFAAPILMAYITAVLSHGHGHIDAAATVWAVVGAAAVWLVRARGHESKLQGSYSSQITWLIRHETKLKNALTEAMSPQRTTGTNMPSSGQDGSRTAAGEPSPVDES